MFFCEKQIKLSYVLQKTVQDTKWLYLVPRCVDPCNAGVIFTYLVNDLIYSEMDSGKVLMAQKTEKPVILADYGILEKPYLMKNL